MKTISFSTTEFLATLGIGQTEKIHTIITCNAEWNVGKACIIIATSRHI